jgi:cytochrome P450
VHFCPDSEFGAYWSITKYNDIMTVDTNHSVFSSESSLGGVNIRDMRLPSFIAMDPPKHEIHRKIVSPLVSQGNLALLEPLIRERSAAVLDALPIGEAFDWVDRVSTELSTQMLATLFDFPFAERRKLAYWSDVATAPAVPGGLVESEDHRQQVMTDCLNFFLELWNERVNTPPRGDLISMLAHGEATRNIGRDEFLGTLILLIVGGSDTTRHSMTGGVLALNENPHEYRKLRANPALIASMVPEIIRWQTPLAHMRRTAVVDSELRGKRINRGDKVVMWYVSGNRDDEFIDTPDQFIIDRQRPQQHMAFGFGIHRCLGNRLADLQLRIVWEEILKRWQYIEVVAPPHRVCSSFVKGFETLPVRIDG